MELHQLHQDRWCHQAGSWRVPVGGHHFEGASLRVPVWKIHIRKPLVTGSHLDHFIANLWGPPRTKCTKPKSIGLKGFWLPRGVCTKCTKWQNPPCKQWFHGRFCDLVHLVQTPRDFRFGRVFTDSKQETRLYIHPVYPVYTGHTCIYRIYWYMP